VEQYPPYQTLNQFHLIQVTGQQHRRCITLQAVNTICAPEDGRNCRPKHVELIGIINKPLLLHLVDCLYYCIGDSWSYKHQIYSSTSQYAFMAWCFIRQEEQLYRIYLRWICKQ